MASTIITIGWLLFVAFFINLIRWRSLGDLAPLVVFFGLFLFGASLMVTVRQVYAPISPNRYLFSKVTLQHPKKDDVCFTYFLFQEKKKKKSITVLKLKGEEGGNVSVAPAFTKVTTYNYFGMPGTHIDFGNLKPVP